jgi:transposase-like protein
MPKYITPEQKLSVIEDWLNGETREDIARKHNIGSGTVYNILFMNGGIALVLKKQRY